MILTKESILQKLKEHSPYLISQYGLKRIGLFGSYATGTPTQSSDIDIVAEFKKPIGLKFVEFTAFLEDVFQHHTDVLTPIGIERIRNKEISKSIQKSIIYV